MNRILLAAFCVLNIVLSNTYSQTFINEDFDGDSLSSLWNIVEGSTSNFSVNAGRLNVLNTVGGVEELPWRNVSISAEFIACDSFFFTCDFNYQRLDYRGFDIFIRNASGQSVAWVRLWDSPSDWILLGKGPGTTDCYGPELSTTYVPLSMQMYRSMDTLRIIWDGVEQWKCQVLDTIATLEFRFSDCPVYGGNVAGIFIERIFASSQSCCPCNGGDVNGDGTVANILDLTFLVDRIFRGGSPVPCH